MMGNALKDNGASVTMQIKGDGPLGTILTVSDSEGNVRGYVQNPAVDLRPARGRQAGRRHRRRPQRHADGHQGPQACASPTSARSTCSAARSPRTWLPTIVESEQIPSACGLGVLIDRDRSVLTAGGYLIQLLPGAGEDAITKVEGGIYAAPSVTNQLQATNPDPADLLQNGAVRF